MTDGHREWQDASSQHAVFQFFDDGLTGAGWTSFARLEGKGVGRGSQCGDADGREDGSGLHADRLLVIVLGRLRWFLESWFAGSGEKERKEGKQYVLLKPSTSSAARERSVVLAPSVKEGSDVKENLCVLCMSRSSTEVDRALPWG